MRCHPIIRTLVVYGLLGAVATVLSSWAIHTTHFYARWRAGATSWRTWNTGVAAMTREQWIDRRLIPEHLRGATPGVLRPGENAALLRPGWFRTRDSAVSVLTLDGQDWWITEVYDHTEVGAPWLALSVGRYWGVEPKPNPRFPAERTGAFSLAGGVLLREYGSGYEFGVGRFALPIRPVWPGFAINTTFYGLALFGLVRGVRTLRRDTRHRHGRCGACGYDATGLDQGAICPECGRTLRQSAKTTAHAATPAPSPARPGAEG